ncbi:MAG: hypothetical protein OEV64_14060 [Desulfobulbaceae bacterium]|nr:hypothetical protein [Desulfobulbaceae bacterium]
MNMTKEIVKILICSLIVTGSFGCSYSLPKEQNIPEGFAPYADSKIVRAVSSDGVMYRIRREKNEPFAELAFWKEALKKRMVDAGYTFMKDEDIDMGKRPGYLLELAAPLGTQDYTYLIALCLQDDQLVIVEAAGEMTSFKTRRQEIIATVQGLEP